MKKVLFISAITMAMFLLTSCAKDCLNCGYNQQQNNNQGQGTQVPAPKECIVAFDTWKGVVKECPKGPNIDVYGWNQNFLGSYPPDKPSILKTLQGHIYYPDKVAPVTVSSPIVALVNYYGEIVGDKRNLNDYHVISVEGSGKRAIDKNDTCASSDPKDWVYLSKDELKAQFRNSVYFKNVEIFTDSVKIDLNQWKYQTLKVKEQIEQLKK